MSFVEYGKTLEKFYTSWIDHVKNWNDLLIRYNVILANATSETIRENNASYQDLFSQNSQSKLRRSFDQHFRDGVKNDAFCDSLSRVLDSWFELAEYYGANKSYRNLIDMFSLWNRLFEPVRDNFNRTPSEQINMNGDYHLLHYKSDKPYTEKTPILIIYSLINRHYILDLLPEVSVVKQLIDAGFDVYATDWGTPVSFDQGMTLERYTHEYVENSVNKIRELTGSEKITLFGYCWGGIFSFIFSALHPELVKNLILHATPLDLQKPNTVIEKWAKNLNPDKMVEKLGNVPGQLLNIAFTMRDPLESILKYPNYFKKLHSGEDLRQFFAIETWLYDSRPIMGYVYKEIIKRIYQKNDLMSGKMKIGCDTVELKNITMPVLNIVGLNDDLVPPDSSRYVLCEIPSADKTLIEFPTGHVGLCISKRAHNELWPKVVNWIKERS